MCRIDERIYISADGRRSKFEEAFPCEKARGKKLCLKVKKRTSEYYTKQGSVARDDTPSPNNPPTPTGTGTYIVQQRRPSQSSSRPSGLDVHKTVAVAPAEIHISFGSKKDKEKKYFPSISVTPKTQKRTSLGASSVGSNEFAVDSPGSEASNTIHRTGFPETPLPSSTDYIHPDGYMITPTIPHSYHHRQTSSASSSRTPSLYITSDPDHDYESPTSHRSAKYPPTIVHNPSTGFAPSSPSRNHSGHTSKYRTSIVAPQRHADDIHTHDGLYPLDYADFADRSASSHASSGAPESTRKGKDRDDRRRKKEEELLRQAELDRQIRAAEERAKAENVKQVRFELGRAESRAKERAENTLAEKEKIRAEEREAARRRNQQELDKQDRERRELEEQLAKERKKDKAKASTNDYTTRPAGSRRMSMTQAQRDEQARLLAAEGLTIDRERQLAEAREREEQLSTFKQQEQLATFKQQEQLATFKQKQEATGYYDPRGGDRSLSGLARRDSLSRGNAIAPALNRTNSNRRTSISQPDPPNYSTRLPTARQNNGPPISFPSNFNKDYRPPSARRPSHTTERPVVVPPPRGSGSDLENPFVPNSSVLSPSHAPRDPWDLRNVDAALPRDNRYTMQSRAQKASRAMGKVAGYADVFDDDSDSQEAYPSPTKLSGKVRKKHMGP